MRKEAIFVCGLLLMPVLTSAQQSSGPVSPWDNRGYAQVFGGGQSGSHLLTDTSTFTIYDEQASIATSQPYGGGAVFGVGGGARVWRNVVVGLTYTRFADNMETAVRARAPHPLFLNRFRDAEELRADNLQHVENAVHLSATYMVPLSEDFTLGVSLGPSFVGVSHEFARDALITETGASPDFATVGLSDVSFVRSSRTAATVNVGADVTYNLPFSIGSLGRLGATLGLRYAGGSVDLDGAAGPTEVKYGGAQFTGGLRVTF
ncbi:MAG: hypothetical protein H0V80_10510 [Acidobacteria bacterium]|nr:hypothetical protein [Acidobacteriota bacterium]